MEASWEEAFAEIDRRLAPILADGDRNATAVYLGNPNAHTLDGLVHLRAMIKALGTRNVSENLLRRSKSSVNLPSNRSAGGL